jgi:hypothetical protein
MQLEVPSFILELSETSMEAKSNLHFLEAQPKNIEKDPGKFF